MPEGAEGAEGAGPRSTEALRRELERFEALVDRAEGMRRRLGYPELRELARLYRLHSARLARQRERDDDPAALRHLNALCVRAYTFLYAPRLAERPAGPRLADRLPALAARAWRAVALAWALLAAGALVGGVLGAREPEALPALVPGSMYPPEAVERLVASPEARAELLAERPTPGALDAIFGSSLFVHNTRVGLLSAATGVFLAVPTALLQLYNGVVLGAFASIFVRGPELVPFLAWILPHGIPELTAISLCAAGGLLLGGAVAAPGRRRRREALREATEPALGLVGLSLPLFLAAALVESFVRESALGTAPRLAVAAAFALALGAALATLRALARRHRAATGWLRELTSPAPAGAPGSGSAPAR